VTAREAAAEGDGPLVLAVDCSTTAAKAVAIDGTGRVRSAAARPLTLSRPGPGRHEQDADQWWAATRAALTETVRGLVRPERVSAIALTHQRESFVCLDSAGRPDGPAILWLDSRAATEIEDLGSDRVHVLSGKPPDVTPAIYKLAWLARHEPRRLAGARWVADVHAFLSHRLTGRMATSIASADSLGLLDLASGRWSEELLALAGVGRDQLPDLVPPGSVIGPLLPAVADAIGLPACVPLVAGIGDGQAAGLGADVTAPGVAYLNLGTSMVMGVASHRYVTSAAFRTLAGAPPGTFVLETVLNAASYLTTWFRREFGDPGLAGAPDPDLEAAAAALPPGADGLLTVPYWNCAQTPYWDTHARGATIGWHGAHTRAHLYRSLMEAVAFELRLHLDGLEASTGSRVELLRAMGGGSRSVLWTQIIADVTGRHIQLCDDAEVSARGAAVLAWVGAQLPVPHPGEPVAAVAAAMATFSGVMTPGAENVARYDRLVPVHRGIYPALRQVFGDLARAGQPGGA
jgi:xylulokinase